MSQQHEIAQNLTLFEGSFKPRRSRPIPRLLGRTMHIDDMTGYRITLTEDGADTWWWHVTLHGTAIAKGQTPISQPNAQFNAERAIRRHAKEASAS